MNIKVYIKNNCLVIPGLISFFLLCVFSFHVFAETIENKVSDSQKDMITIIPLNITASKSDKSAVRLSVERFLLQRLNGQSFVAENTEKLVGIESEELNKIYTSLNSNKVDERIKTDGDNSYASCGNVVVLGSSVMIDFFLYHIQSGKRVVEHSDSGTDLGAVLTAADAYTKKVKAILTKDPAGNLNTVKKETTQVNSNPESFEKVFIKSGKVDGEITAVVFSKIDLSGRVYAVYALAEKIVVMEISDGNFIFKAEFKNKKHDKIIGLNSIDTDQDGVEELVVSNIKEDNRTISSFVLKWQGKAFKKVLSDINWIFAKAGLNESENSLYAQKHNTLKTTLDSGIYKVVFEKGQLVVPDKKLNLPKWILLPGVSIHPISDLIYGVAFRPDNRLRAFTKTDEVFWESSDSFGGSKTFFAEKHKIERDLKNRIWLHSPVVVSDVYKENKYPEIVTVNNIDSTGNLLARVRSVNESRLTIYAVSEMACNLFAQTDKISGYISGFDLDKTLYKGDVCLVYSVIKKGKNLFADDTSFIVLQNANSLKKLKW